MMNKQSEKSSETKLKIQTAFFTLYPRKTIDKITIKEITDLAQLNRGTFYTYYTDIYDLRDHIQQSFLEVFQSIASGVIEAIMEDRDINSHIPPEPFHNTQVRWFMALLGPNGDPSFVNKIKQAIKQLIRIKLQDYPQYQHPQLDYILEYILSAHIGVFTFWLQQNPPLTIHQLINMLQNISVTGPVTFLRQK